jgi:hypothetical protein
LSVIEIGSDFVERRVKFDGARMIVSPANEALANQTGSLEFVWNVLTQIANKKID